MKYCYKCACSLNDSAKFCERCGAVQPDVGQTQVQPVVYKYYKTEEKTDSNRTIAFIISLLTSPIVYLISLFGKETGLKKIEDWKGKVKYEEYTYLPENIVIALYVFLTISVITVIALGITSKEKTRSKSLITKLLVIFNVIFTLIITAITTLK